MYQAQHCFTAFKSPIDSYQLPERFTFPFYYEPHPLCVLAAKELQAYLSSQTDWQHNFGLGKDTNKIIGKMFGVLLVRNNGGELGYLAAFSGKLAEQNLIDGFVPPIFDMLTKDSFFHAEQQGINQLTRELTELEGSSELSELRERLATLEQEADDELEAMRATIIEGRKVRKLKRAQAEAELSQQSLAGLNVQLGKESVAEKNRLKAIKRHWDGLIAEVSDSLQLLETEIESLKAQRATQSNALQQKLFAQYRFLNQAGELRDLNQIFKDAPNQQPPAGAGECAAPKLLQYAFAHGLTPLAIAEFWWGASPKSEVKQHKQFYGACHGKCQPILNHMLKGIEMDDNPLLSNPAEGKVIDILYQDEAMAVINKPAEFLSVPGKNISDSVYARMKQRFPTATGPLIVHRLDMSTSGLMVIALSKEANRTLVQQFIGRTVEKRYVAKLAGIVAGEQGEISLPLRVDLDDRPRQLVCFEHGKHAHTLWQVKARDDNHTWLYLYPQTGRTHQLRVHCAHIDGLDLPIIGDDLYGARANRLHLHAERLVLNHPITGERLTFEVDAEF
ncbi:RluA family pseudouridine synthase [Shewanella psychrotolerans]|uniref:RluA family pseudouridine synthase n=1 Tax=Shewanella psychrotolerans TaxID=2864206 RepID=UPI001C655E4A|nr:RluA family pseudouridine synthase [Shewanella psychrotolerans]QYK02600.1 RNA pseudouridine synthase [Shewanella psychrotolerans]